MDNKIRSLILQRLQNDRKKQDSIQVTKCVTVGIDSDNSCSVANRPGFIWVRENMQDGAIFQAFNTTIKTLVGLQVLVSRGYDAAYRRVVIGIDWDAVVEDYIGIPFDLPNHAATHEWMDAIPGIDAVSTYPRSIVPFRVYPQNGLNVGIARGYYMHDNEPCYFTGESMHDLSAYVPSSGNVVGLLIYFDLSDGIVKELSGLEVSDSGEPVYPAIPNGIFPLCKIKIYHTTTQLSESNIVEDLRPIFSFSSNGSSVLSEIAILAEEIDLELSNHIVNG